MKLHSLSPTPLIAVLLLVICAVVAVGASARTTEEPPESPVEKRRRRRRHPPSSRPERPPQRRGLIWCWIFDCPPPEELTITERLYKLGAEYTPDFDALIEEKLPTIETVIEEHRDNPLRLQVDDECIADMRDEYVSLEASIASKEGGYAVPSGEEARIVTAEDFDLHAFIAERLPAIEDALLDSLSEEHSPDTQVLIESAKYTLLAGGKRIRPLLTLAAFEMFAPPGSSREMAMPAALSSEMVHAMSLISDDLPSMDDDELRRGLPSNHVVYGEDVAMLSAGMLMSYAFQYTIERTMKVDGADPAVVLEVARRLAAATGIRGLAGGEAMDVLATEKENATLLDLEYIHLHKTAALIKYAVASGALLGGASPEEVRAMEAYAENVGLAFQVVDDVLDVTSTSEELGKTTSDEELGKLTYPAMLGVDGACKEAERLVGAAKESLAPFGDGAATFVAFADFVLERAAACKNEDELI